jgi:hypothetical protein
VIAAVSWIRLDWWDDLGRRSFLCADAATTLTAAGVDAWRAKRRFAGLPINGSQSEMSSRRNRVAAIAALKGPRYVSVVASSFGASA